ncbi:hypothetical protein CASFOL_034671 [Castilleja foliolosa]|uniref:Uncharacterized protein n=1 Tax=Castilleja foliolosa TaxID=1961234 RepID=A0ABD3BRD4_9LAMI
MEEFSPYIQNHQNLYYCHHSHYPHPDNSNANYYEPYNFYESYEPEVYYDHYESPSEQEITLSTMVELTQKLNEQMNERFDNLERVMGQIAKEVKELQQSKEMSENVWISPVDLEVEPLVSLEPVHFNIAEETHVNFVSKIDSLISKISFDLFNEKIESLVVEDIVEPPVEFFSYSVTDDYSRFWPPKVEEVR